MSVIRRDNVHNNNKNTVQAEHVVDADDDHDNGPCQKSQGSFCKHTLNSNKQCI